MTVWFSLFSALKDAIESLPDTEAEQVPIINTGTLIFALTCSPLPLCPNGFLQTTPLALLTGMQTHDLSLLALPHLLTRTMTIK